MNVLLTCAGRRNYLVEYFRDAVGPGGRVVAVDASPYAPALVSADEALTVPRVNEPDYLSVLVKICQDQEIGLLVSLNDLELPLLARERERFLAIGTIPVVASPGVVDLCFDKWATHRFLASVGLRGPATFISLEAASAAITTGTLAYPVVLKPRWGTASIALEFAADEAELQHAYPLVRGRTMRSMIAEVSGQDPEHCVLIQQLMHGDEYGLDIVNDLRGAHVTTFVKRKLGMRAGETDRAITCRDEALEGLGRTIGEQLGHIGNLDCDVFLNEKGSFVLELNPRFGGGYPFSHVAGVNLPAALVAWAQGEPHEDAWLRMRDGVMASKCDRVVVLPSSGV